MSRSRCLRHLCSFAIVLAWQRVGVQLGGSWSWPFQGFGFGMGSQQVDWGPLGLRQGARASGRCWFTRGLLLPSQTASVGTAARAGKAGAQVSGKLESRALALWACAMR